MLTLLAHQATTLYHYEFIETWAPISGLQALGILGIFLCAMFAPST